MSQQKKIQNQLFVVFLFSFIGFIYFANILLVWIERHQGTTVGKVLYISIFHIFFFMLLWSLIKTMTTDPGKVPMYWGYFLDDPEHQKRRYCLICHIFKPERCHHCSACNRCVLNMDHHCPWINNCVGFYNRKYFILMLTYVILTAIVAFFGMFPTVCQILSELKNAFKGKSTNESWFTDFLIVLACVLDAVAIGVIGMFYKFHIQLILSNTTTIQSLDKQRANGPQHGGANFDMGAYYNWVQVFGKNQWLWPFPVFMETGKPVGDGVVWPQQVSLENLEKEKENSQEALNTTPARSNREQPAELNNYNSNFANNNNAGNNINNTAYNSGTVGNNLNGNNSANYGNNSKGYNIGSNNSQISTNNPSSSSTFNLNNYGASNYTAGGYSNGNNNSNNYSNMVSYGANGNNEDIYQPRYPQGANGNKYYPSANNFSNMSPSKRQGYKSYTGTYN